MSSPTSQASLTSGFIDLASFDEQEKYMYGGQKAVSYFVRRVRKSSWFTVVPVILTRASGNPDFNVNWAAAISRAGDYLIRNWLRVTTPTVTIDPVNNQFGSGQAGQGGVNNGRIRWTRNFMHNLVREGMITFNDLTAQRFDNYFLDFWSAFTIPEGKRNAYNIMIGNFSELTDPVSIPGNAPANQVLPSATLNLPLPWFCCRDTGCGLPTAALPYNDMRFVFTFRDWTELLVLDAISGPSAGVSVQPRASDVIGSPKLVSVDCWASYAIVSNSERKLMGKVPRDILIEQVQTASVTEANVAGSSNLNFDIRFSHSVKAIFFGMRNKTTPSEWSNYTTAMPVPTTTGVIFSPGNSADPVDIVSLLYENTARLSNMGADYFSLVDPFYTCPVIAHETGYHVYSYSLDLYDVNPKASTNFGKLSNVSLALTFSNLAKTGAQATGTVASPGTLLSLGQGLPQRFDIVCFVVNHNIIRIAGGALGFPVL